MPPEETLSPYSYYSDLIDRVLEDPSSYQNSISNIEKSGNKLYNQDEVGDNQPANYLSEAKKMEEDKIAESSVDRDLYGFIPGDWLPNWVKNGYNNSIEGLGYQIATGKSYFDIGTYAQDEKDYPFLEDIGSTVTSFLTITDIATIAGGGFGAGAIANMGYKKAAQKTIQGLIRKNATKGLGKEGAEKLARETVEKIVNENKLKASQLLVNASSKKGIGGGITTKLATEIVEAGAKKLPNKIMSEAIGGAGGLGAYSGIQSMLNQEVQTGDISAIQTLKDTVIGTGLGAFTAGSGAGMRQYLTKKLGTPVTKIQKIAHTTAVKALETAEFGVATPVLEGRVPELKDFAHAAGVIGGLTTARAIPRTAKKLAGIDNPTYGLKEATSEMARARFKTKKAEEIWKSKDGNELTNVSFDFSQKKGNIIKGNEVTRGKDGEIVKSDKEVVITEKDFKSQGFARKRAGMDTNKMENSRRQETFGSKTKLNISDSEFRNRVEGITGKKVDPKKHKTGYSQLSHVEQIKLLDLLRKERLQKKIFDSHKSEGYDEFFIPKSVLFSKVIPFMQVKNRVRTKAGEQTMMEINKIDARGITLSGQWIQELRDAGIYSGGSIGRLFGRYKVQTPDGELTLRTESKAKAYFEDLGRRMDSAEINPKTGKPHQQDVDVVKVRKTMNRIFKKAEKAGLDISGFRENYFPHRYKKEYIGILGTDITKLINKDPALEGTRLSQSDMVVRKMKDIINSKDVSAETKQILEAIGNNISKQSNLNEAQSLALAFQQVRDTIYGQRYAIAGNIERERTVELPKEIKNRILEWDTRLVLTKYVNDAAKRISQVEVWGKEQKVIENRLSELKKLRESVKDSNPNAFNLLEQERRLLRQVVDSFTNMIEVQPESNFKDPFVRKFWSEAVNFEVATKIGLGYATVPNITQTLISTAVRAGYWNTFKGAYKLATDKNYKKQIGSSGISQLSVFQMVSGLEPSSSFFGRAAHTMTKISGFQHMNKFNQYLAAAAGREYVKGLIKAKDSKITARRNWAKENLKELGLPDNVKKLTKRQDLESMYRFSRDAQLQRNVLNDPLSFNDPRIRPFILFKRFGYKQANWIREQVVRDVKYGNVLPILRLGVGGALGGSFVIWARKKLNNILSGEDEVFDETRLFLPGLPPGTPLGTSGSDVNTDMSKFTWSDFFDIAGAVGAMGFISDVVANEDRIRALEFLVKPAIAQDSHKFLVALQKIYKDIEDYGVGVGSAQRSLKYFAPMFGTTPRRLAQKFETEGQKETYIRYRRGIVRGRILDYLIDGKDKDASKTLLAWNRSYPEESLFYDDIGIDAIFERLENKYKKRLNP